MYEQNEELAALAAKVIASHPEMEDLKYCRIAYLSADKEKKSRGKPVYAETERVSDKIKAVAPYDFLITFYMPNCDYLDEKRMKILMYHELLHVGYDPVNGTFAIIPHDVEDFRGIILQYGPDWITQRTEDEESEV